jgi:hypothetical protein
MVHVDHRNPIHDHLCRCTSCKPATPDEASAGIAQFRMTMVCVVVLAIGAAFIR